MEKGKTYFWGCTINQVKSGVQPTHWVQLMKVPHHISISEESKALKLLKWKYIELISSMSTIYKDDIYELYT